ncbi:hypothetical protein K0B96_02190 [Horticoccus luteus]|uniref:Uncharacterized protein n=1 Tax=Horticoccus luteus TaxID=2862869 RepID=A0A8F9TWU2_9BACT|nr:hypothetical protein [Horticoccus luteus]QYM79446.1 hypothetical protein K0B96_02190 [Horticoccus luteus]
MNPHDESKLEHLIHRTLRSLPDHPAPRSLEHRVLAAIEARRALPWWHRSYANWPAPIRASFFVLSALAAAVVLGGAFLGGHETSRVAADFARNFSWLVTLRGAAGDVIGAFGTVFKSIPPLWIYGLLAAVAGGYAALLGMGAAVFRTFFSQRSTSS